MIDERVNYAFAKLAVVAGPNTYTVPYRIKTLETDKVFSGGLTLVLVVTAPP